MAQTFLQHYAKFKFKAISQLPENSDRNYRKLRKKIIGYIITLIIGFAIIGHGLISWFVGLSIIITASIQAAKLVVNMFMVLQKMVNDWRKTNDYAHKLFIMNRFDDPNLKEIFNLFAENTFEDSFFKPELQNKRQISNAIVDTEYPFMIGNFLYYVSSGDDSRPVFDGFALANFTSTLPEIIFDNQPSAKTVHLNSQFDKRITTTVNGSESYVVSQLNDNLLSQLYDLMVQHPNIKTIKIHPQFILVQFENSFEIQTTVDYVATNRNQYDDAAVIISTVIELFTAVTDPEHYKINYLPEHTIRRKLSAHLAKTEIN